MRVFIDTRLRTGEKKGGRGERDLGLNMLEEGFCHDLCACMFLRGREREREKEREKREKRERKENEGERVERE